MTDMKILIPIFVILILLALIYVLALMGRREHRGLQALRGWVYAHRGLHGAGRPENSMAAFRAALEHGYGVELDVHLLSDGNLAVIHDASLKRTANMDVLIEDLTTEDLKGCFLEGTFQSIPTFREVLQLFDGKAPIIVELKAERGNHAALVDTAIAQLADYKGTYCIESFDPRCILHLKKHYPKVIRGQLAENYFKSNSCKLPWFLKFILSYQLGNFLLQPDFVAYKYADRKNLSNLLIRKLWGIQGVSWTIRSPEEQKTALEEGWLPIFEGFEP